MLPQPRLCRPEFRADCVAFKLTLMAAQATGGLVEGCKEGYVADKQR